MIADRSLEVLAPLVAMTQGWDDASVGMWSDMVGKLESVPAAMDATHAVLNTWKDPGRPPWALWLGEYERARGRRGSVDRGLPAAPAGAAMSLREYEATQQSRAERGDREAAARLEIIAKHRAKLAKLTRP